MKRPRSGLRHSRRHRPRTSYWNFIVISLFFHLECVRTTHTLYENNPDIHRTWIDYFSTPGAKNQPRARFRSTRRSRRSAGASKTEPGSLMGVFSRTVRKYVRREREKKTTRVGSRVSGRSRQRATPGVPNRTVLPVVGRERRHGDDDDDGDEYDDEDDDDYAREGRRRRWCASSTSSSSSSFGDECDDDAMPTRSSRRPWGVSSVVVFDVFVVVFVDVRRDEDDEGDWRKRRRRRRWWARTVSRSGVGRSDDGECANWTGINNINDEDA